LIDLLRGFIRTQRRAGIQTVAWFRFPDAPTRWADELADSMVFHRMIDESDRAALREMLLDEVRDISLLVDDRTRAVLNRDYEQDHFSPATSADSVETPRPAVLAPPEDADSPFPMIDRLVRKGFGMQVWKAKAVGVWAAIGPYDTTIDVMRDASNDCEFAWMRIREHLESATWLPWVCAHSPFTAMTQLEARLASLPHDQLRHGTNWEIAIQDIANYLFESVRDFHGDLSSRLKPIPASAELYLEERGLPLLGPSWNELHAAGRRSPHE
jgi:hypothetical protein